MVQQGGSQDDVRINIVIDTITRLQALDVAQAKLEGLSQRLVQNRNALGQFAKGLKTELDPALKDTGKNLGRIIQEGFGPRFVNSIQGVNQAFIRSGQTIKRYVVEAQAVGAVSPQVANGLNFIAQGMTAVGVTGRASVEQIAQLREQLGTLQAVTQADVEILNALNMQLNTLATQTVVAAEQQTARLNRQLTGTQKAGQGMLLSFALTQAAAGKVSQAMFGLGFAVIFTGTQFLNLTTILTAVSLAAVSIMIDKLQNRLSAADQITAQVTKSTERYTDMLIVLKGEARLTSEALADMTIDNLESLNAFEAYRKVLFKLQEEKPGSWFEGLGRSISRSGQDAASAAQDFAKLFNVFAEADIIKGLMQEWRRDTDLLFEGLREGVAQARHDVEQEFQREWEMELVLKHKLAPVEEDKANLEKALDAYTQIWDNWAETYNEKARETARIHEEAIREGLQAETDTIRDGAGKQITIIRRNLEEEIRLRRKALSAQINTIREQYDARIDVIRDALDRERSVIKDRQADAIEAIRDHLDDQIDVIRDRLDDRLDVIRDRAKDEIEIERDKISELTKEERSLERILNDLRGRRAEIWTEVFGAEAQLAALERETALAGVGATRESAIIRARIDGLRAEGAAVNESIRRNAEQRDGIQDQIDTVEELIDAIEEARDNAIDAAKDQADAQIEAARDVADERTKAAKKAADAAIDAIEDVADRDIKLVNKARDRAVTAAQERADAINREAQRAATGQIAEINRATTLSIRAASKRADADIRAAQDTARTTIRENNRIAANRKAHFSENIKWLDEILNRQLRSINREHRKNNEIFTRTLPYMRALVKLWRMVELSSENSAKAWGTGVLGTGAGLSYQIGTRSIPGALGQPRLIVAHGGEEVRARGALPEPSGRPVNVYITIEHMDVNKPQDLNKLTRAFNRKIGTQANISLRSRRHGTR